MKDELIAAATNSADEVEWNSFLPDYNNILITLAIALFELALSIYYDLTQIMYDCDSWSSTNILDVLTAYFYANTS